MDLIIKYTGLLAMFFAWIFVVLPGITAGVKGTKQTITYATKIKKYRIIITFGLITGAIFQTIFLLYLLSKFQIRFISASSLLFLSTTISTVLAAMTVENKYEKIHTLFSEYYFFFHPISIILIGLSIRNSYYLLFIISMVVPLLYLIGEGYLIHKYRSSNALMEQLAFFLLSIWTIFITFA